MRVISSIQHSDGADHTLRVPTYHDKFSMEIIMVELLYPKENLSPFKIDDCGKNLGIRCYDFERKDTVRERIQLLQPSVTIAILCLKIFEPGHSLPPHSPSSLYFPLN